MPRELVAIAPGQTELREYRESELGEQDLRIKTEFASPKHGTESHGFTVDSPFSDRYFDDSFRIFLAKDKEEPSFPKRLGNMAVGVITEAGNKVTKFKVGQRVYGHWPIRETYTVKETQGGKATKSLGSGVRESRIHLLPLGMTPQEAVLLDPGHFALAAIRDADVRLGEWVAVYGLGAIGLLIAQMAKLSGAERVFVVEPLPSRRKLALALGAEQALDPVACDAGYEIKKATDGKGVDVAIDASGSYKGLQGAIRSVHFSGLVVACSWYHGPGTDLRFDEELFLERITLRASMPVWGNPSRDYPMWDDERVEDTVYRMMLKKRLHTESLVYPVRPFEQAAQAYREIHEYPDRCVKLGITFA